MTSVLFITTASVLLCLCLRSDSFVSARIEASIATLQSERTLGINRPFLSSPSTISSLSATVRHRSENLALSTLNRINIRGGHYDLTEEKIADSTDYETEFNSEPISDENTDGDGDVDGDSDMDAIVNLSNGDPDENTDGDFDEDTVNENYPLNEATDVSSSADTYGVVQPEMSVNGEQNVEGEVTLGASYEINNGLEDNTGDISATYDASIAGESEEVMLGLDRGVEVDNNEDHSRESFPDENDSFVGTDDDQHIDRKDRHTELSLGLKSSDDEEMLGEDGETTDNDFPGIGNYDEDTTATDNSINLQEEIEEEILSNEHQEDYIHVVEVTGEEGNDEEVSNSQEHGSIIDQTDEIMTEANDAGEEGEGIPLVSTDEMDDVDESYPSGSDSTAFVDGMDLAGSDSTAFVDRMDLADAYDDEDTLVEMDNHDDTADVVETDIDGNGVALDIDGDGVAPGHDDDIDLSSPVESEDKVESLASSKTNGVQYMITQNMHRILTRELEYTAQEVRYMKPDVAAVLVKKMLRRPESGMPLQFYTEEGHRELASSGKRNQLKLLLETINRVWKRYHTPILAAIGVVALGGGGKVIRTSSGNIQVKETTINFLTENEEEGEVEEGEDSDGVISIPGVLEMEHETLVPRGKYREDLDNKWPNRLIVMIREKFDNLLK